MTPPTPMHAYQSITTARVMPPAAPTRPAAYATRMAHHIALGKTPAQAMAAIERADGHMGRIPVKLDASTLCGGRGKNKPKHTKPLTHRIMDILTNDWLFISADIAAALGSSRENIYAALRVLREQGRVEQTKLRGHSKMMWRIKP